MLCLLLKDWHCFKINYCNLPFPEICRSQFHFLISLVSSCYQTAKIPLRTSLRNKQKFRCERACETNKYLMNKKAYWIKNHCHFKGLYKTSCYKTKSNFSQFLYSNLLLYECFFSFLIQAFVKSEKLIRLHHPAFIIYENGENLKILIEIFREKLIISNVILTAWNLKFFFCSPTMMAGIERPPFVNLWIRPWLILKTPLNIGKR